MQNSVFKDFDKSWRVSSNVSYGNLNFDNVHFKCNNIIFEMDISVRWYFKKVKRLLNLTYPNCLLHIWQMPTKFIKFLAQLYENLSCWMRPHNIPQYFSAQL